VCETGHEGCLARRLVLWVLLEKITGLQLLKKYTAFCGPRRFITAFTCACHLPLSWASSIQSTPQHLTSSVSILILSSHLRRPSIIREIQSTEMSNRSRETPLRFLWTSGRFSKNYCMLTDTMENLSSLFLSPCWNHSYRIHLCGTCCSGLYGSTLGGNFKLCYSTKTFVFFYQIKVVWKHLNAGCQTTE